MSVSQVARKRQAYTRTDVRVVLLLILVGCGRVGFVAADGSATLVDAVATDPYSTAVLADDPIGYWRLDETTGTIAHDELGAHPGTYDPACKLGVPGAVSSDTAVQFDGSACAIEIGDAFEFDGVPSFSIELWAAPDIVDNQVRRLVGRRDGEGSPGYQLAFFAPDLWFEQFVDSGDVDYLQTDPPALGVFEHVVVAVDGTQQALYINGVVAAQTNFMPSMPSASGTVLFGDISPGEFFKFSGVLDEVAFYAHPLDATRVAAHYAAR